MDYIWILITVFSLIFFFSSFRSKFFPRRSELERSHYRDEIGFTKTFYPSKWAYSLSFLMVLVALFFATLNFLFPNSDLLSWGIFLTISFIFLGVAVGLWVGLKKTSLIISEGEICYKSLFNNFSVDSSKIVDVYFQAGFIVVDSGIIPRNTIPLIFPNSSIIVAHIKESRNRGSLGNSKGSNAKDKDS